MAKLTVVLMDKMSNFCAKHIPPTFDQTIIEMTKVRASSQHDNCKTEDITEINCFDTLAGHRKILARTIS